MSAPHDHDHDHGHDPLPGIRHVVAVGSGKGGVGKSTVAVNLALALAASGHRVGLVDADVLGPSLPGMLGLPFGEPPKASPAGRLLPSVRHGVAAVSMGLLRSDDEPAIMRGPMVTKYLQMFLAQVEWGELDYLILDLPPGTGDTQLTLAQSVQLTGAIIVTTPQDVSLRIARRGLRMFETVHVPILGIIENMGTFTCPHCGSTTDVFRHGGGERMSRELDVPFLGSLPLDGEVVEAGDAGVPIVAADPDSVSARSYVAISEALVAQIEGRPTTTLPPFLWTWDSNEGAPPWPADDAVIVTDGAEESPAGLRRRDPRTLSIRWLDGNVDDLDVRDLRLACPCALCVEEMSGQALLNPESVPTDVLPRKITSVGTYAVIIDWSDGHGTGIYTYGYLRALGRRLAATVSEDV